MTDESHTLLHKQGSKGVVVRRMKRACQASESLNSVGERLLGFGAGFHPDRQPEHLDLIAVAGPLA